MKFERDDEWQKFAKEDERYFHYIDELEKMGAPVREVIYNFPVFVGQVNIARSLFFYELYKKVLSLSGNIAEIGTYKGASFMLWAKLIKLFEPNNPTRAYGFDWFQGMEVGEHDHAAHQGTYQADYATLRRLVELQGLDDVALLCKMDVTKELEPFLEERPWLRFKLVFVDCGVEDVLEASLRSLWPRLVEGGVLIMDHYGLSTSPTESDIVEKYIGNHLVMQMPFNRHSSGYVIKRARNAEEPLHYDPKDAILGI